MKKQEHLNKGPSNGRHEENNLIDTAAPKPGKNVVTTKDPGLRAA